MQRLVRMGTAYVLDIAVRAGSPHARGLRTWVALLGRLSAARIWLVASCCSCCPRW